MLMFVPLCERRSRMIDPDRPITHPAQMVGMAIF